MGVGFAKDGEGAARNNRKLLLNQRDKYFKKQKYKLKRNRSLHFKSASKHELQRIRKKIQKQKMRDKRITVFVLFVFLFVTAYFIFG